MSTRARTRAATAAAAAASSAITPQTPSQSTPKTKTHSTRRTSAATVSVKQEQPQTTDPSEKENIKATIPSTRPSTTKKAKLKPPKTVHCTCTRGDDGSPMIRCAECKVWYHFICVDLSEREAEEINIYICSACTQSTGRKTAMIWEGSEALDDCGSDVDTVAPKTIAQKSKKPKVTVSTKMSSPVLPLVPPQSPSEESGAGSEDDYVAEEAESKATTSKGKRRLRRHSSSGSESNPSSDEETMTRKRRAKHRRLSRSHTPISPVVPSKSRLKRKSSVAESSQTPVKRRRSETITEDPVRKYCLGKLEEVFREVFFRYPHVYGEIPAKVEGQDPAVDGQGQAQPEGGIVPKKLEDMTEEEKEALTNASKRFAAELEQCVFGIYSEPDKNGAPHAAGKYKDRFRMLQFNLSKPDRTVIHQRIVNGRITPKEISLMSSTDLADEETKQHIKIAEKESLEQTILQKPVVPRAKITHKGLQDIEDVNGELARAREIERQREREQEEEERRERERRERLKAVEKQRQRTQSLSVPPESPVVPSHSPIADTASSTAWGAPPPVPAHVLQQQGTGDDILNPSIRPLFTHTISDVDMAVTPEPELNLADLINIDEDGAEQDGGVSGPGSGDAGLSSVVAPPPTLDQPIEPDGTVSDKPPGAHHTASGLGRLTASPTSPTTPVGVSPFSATRPRGLSFDLNSLWSGPKDDDISPTPKSPSHSTSALDADKVPVKITSGNDRPGPGIGGDAMKDLGVMEPERMEVANDDDFDMFLEKEDVVDRSAATGSTEPEPAVKQDPEAIFEALPHCWTGKIHMPLDSAAPQSTTVYATQIGGRTLDHQSLWWKTLFPSEDLRIDGRVATQSSSEFLTQVRLNPAKELIAVAFSPVTEASKADFSALTDYLKSRDRHGLIFPWGQRPKEWCPGRELYLVPLLSSEPLPVYIELLDELKIPSTRKADFMIGIWILGRGKLSGSPPQPPSITTPSAPSAAISAPTVSAPATPAIPPPTVTNIPALPPHLKASASQSPPVLPSPSSVSQTPGTVSTPPQPALPPHINQAALANEVASLTQDQIQNLLRTLSTTNLPFPVNIPTPGGLPGAPQQTSIPGQPSHSAPSVSHPPPPPAHQWPGFPMPPGPLPHGGYPPPPGYGHPPSHSHSLPPPQHGPTDHERRDSYSSPHGHHASGRGGDRDRDRGGGGGWRGGSGGSRDGRQYRGRGKHRGGPGGNAPHRPVDSGWPRRQRGDDGNGSPSRRW